jgi:glyoxylase-like metal-dependent hydrolase (beta-lactamase superfamily II)
MPASAAHQIAPNVWRIPRAAFDFVNSYALVDDDGRVTLVDTGMKSSIKRIRAGLTQIGKNTGDVPRIVLTHAHGDHAAACGCITHRGTRPAMCPCSTSRPGC